MQQIWKDIQGYEGKYQVSNLGGVRSLDRKTGKRYLKGKNLRLFIANNGYYVVTLYSTSNKQKTELVHRLVAKAFLENSYNKKEINHIDGDKSNNKVENLEWYTRNENLKHARDNDLIKNKKILKGEKNINSKLTEVIVLEIREMYKNNYASVDDLANGFKVSRQTIVNVIQRKSWTHI